MSEHEWDVFVFLLSLSLSFWVCVCVSGAVWVERKSFPRTALIENRAFERRRKNNRNSQGSGWKPIGTCLRSRTTRENVRPRLFCLWMSSHLCVLPPPPPRLPKTQIHCNDLVRGKESKWAQMDVEIPQNFSRMAQFPYSTLRAAYMSNGRSECYTSSATGRRFSSSRRRRRGSCSSQAANSQQTDCQSRRINPSTSRMAEEV